MSGAVLGWDVGWSENNRTSGVCVLEWRDASVVCNITRCTALADDQKSALERLLSGRTARMAALDGPLRADLVLKDGATANYRSCESFLTRNFQPRIGKPGQSNSPNGKKLHNAATQVATLLLERVGPSQHKARIADAGISEAFPTSFLGLLLDDPPAKHRNKARSDQFYVAACEQGVLDQLVAELLPDFRNTINFMEVQNHDERAALICALTALCADRRQYVAVGDPVDGYIILPPIKFWSRWALEILHERVTGTERRNLIVEEFSTLSP